MTQPDELLQNQLAALERGVPLEKILTELPPEAQDLAPLLALTAAARSLPHPQMNAAAAQAQQARVAAAARSRQRGIFQRMQPLTRRSVLALAGGVGLFVLLAVVAIGINLLITGPVSAQSAQLANVNGLVEVASSAAGSDWHFVTPGEQMRQGERIRTYADSGASLVFYEGSQTAIGPDSDLTLTSLGGGPGEALKVQMTQNAGTTSHEVVPLRGSGSFFQVNTPASLVSVHGTSFSVTVGSDGQSLTAVNHGKVEVKNDSAVVFLASGQATSVLPGHSPEPPGYQFTLTAPISAIAGNVWTVAGVQISITDQTDVLGTYQVGDLVSIHGRILPDGTWVADQVEPGQPSGKEFTFTGLIESMPGVPGTWVISGHKVMVNGQTELSTDLKVGSPVKVSVVVPPDNGVWLATEIESLEEQEKPTATPSVTGTITATGTTTLTATGTPTITNTATVTGTPATAAPTGTNTATVTGTPATATPTLSLTPTATVIPKNDTSRCDNRSGQQPEALRLAQRYNVSYAEIIAWFCKGFGFGEIDLAYGLSLSSGRPVSDIFSMRSSGMGWGNIKKLVASQTTPMPGSNSNPGNGNGNGNNGNGKGKK